MKIDKLQNKLTRAVIKAGLSWGSFANSIEILSPEEDGVPINTAYWYYNPETKREMVVIRPELIRNINTELLALVIRHELLHKAFYRQVYGATNTALINYVLDACINKILLMAHGRQQMKLSDYLFPPNDNRSGIECICISTITRMERLKIKRNLRNIFDKLYWVERKKCTLSESQSFKNDNTYIPDPVLLYNMLSNILGKSQKKEVEKIYAPHSQAQDGNGNSSSANNKDEDENSSKQNNDKNNKDGDKTEEKEKCPDKNNNQEDKEDNKSERLVFGGKDRLRAHDKETIEQEIKVAQEVVNKAISSGGGYSFAKSIQSIFKKYVYAAGGCDTDGLGDFIKEWETKKQIESIENVILCDVASRVGFEPFPNNLSRTGLEYLALGVSGPDGIPLYLNEIKYGAKKKICCYFDTSPSMNAVIPYMVHIAEFLNGLPDCEIAGGQYEGKYIFSGKVQGLNEKAWGDFIQGKVYQGYVTSFEQVIQHAISQIEEDDVDIIVIFTDGESTLYQETIATFNSTQKTCYTIYMNDLNYYKGYGWKLSQMKKGITSELDKLNGKTFQITLPVREDDDF